MPRPQKLVGLLRDLAKLVDDEASRNDAFAARLEALLAPTLADVRRKGSRSRVRADSAAVPDVMSVLNEKGEEEFRFWLRSFDLAMLKAILKT